MMVRLSQSEVIVEWLFSLKRCLLLWLKKGLCASATAPDIGVSRHVAIALVIAAVQGIGEQVEVVFLRLSKSGDDLRLRE